MLFIVDYLSKKKTKIYCLTFSFFWGGQTYYLHQEKEKEKRAHIINWCTNKDGLRLHEKLKFSKTKKRGEGKMKTGKKKRENFKQLGTQTFFFVFLLSFLSLVV